MEPLAITSSLLSEPTFSVSEPQLHNVLLAYEMTLVREGLAALCNSIGGFQVVSQVGTAAAALTEIERLRPVIALLDLGLSDLAATEVIRRVHEQGLPTRCAVLSDRRDRKTVHSHKLDV
jgi:DNA-binding NarL/FixJ family response regulator